MALLDLLLLRCNSTSKINERKLGGVERRTNVNELSFALSLKVSNATVFVGNVCISQKNYHASE